MLRISPAPLLDSWGGYVYSVMVASTLHLDLSSRIKALGWEPVPAAPALPVCEGGPVLDTLTSRFT